MTNEVESAKRTGTSQKALKNENTLLSYAKVLLTNPSSFVRLRRMDRGEERYVAPPRSYELPAYRNCMKYSTSNEPYVRPTLRCNPRKPVVVALAHELGAYELSDWEFAEAAYWWMKKNMWYGATGFDDASVTLMRGSGMCLDFANAYVALCRCAGIKARYKSYEMQFNRLEQAVIGELNPGFATVAAAGGVIQEAECEVCLDSEWVTAYVAQPAALTATTGWPVTEFGESSLGLYFEPLPGSIRRFESIPFGLFLQVRLLMIFAPATMERLNVMMSRIQKVGLQEIESAGGVEKYNEIAKRRRELASAAEILDEQALKHLDKIIIKNPQNA
jgi:hypothetical protein